MTPFITFLTSSDLQNNKITLQTVSCSSILSLPDDLWWMVDRAFLYRQLMIWLPLLQNSNVKIPSLGTYDIILWEYAFALLASLTMKGHNFQDNVDLLTNSWRRAFARNVEFLLIF
jgi:hypothetical protein